METLQEVLKKEKNLLEDLLQEIKTFKSTFECRQSDNLSLEDDIYMSASVNAITEVENMITSKTNLL